MSEIRELLGKALGLLQQLEATSKENDSRAEMATRQLSAYVAQGNETADLLARCELRIKNLEKIVRSLEERVDPAVFEVLFSGDWREDPLPEISFKEIVLGLAPSA